MQPSPAGRSRTTTGRRVTTHHDDLDDLRASGAALADTVATEIEHQRVRDVHRALGESR
jgi:hypothetical protein